MASRPSAPSAAGRFGGRPASGASPAWGDDNDDDDDDDADDDPADDDDDDEDGDNDGGDDSAVAPDLEGPGWLDEEAALRPAEVSGASPPGPTATERSLAFSSAEYSPSFR